MRVNISVGGIRESLSGLNRAGNKAFPADVNV